MVGARVWLGLIALSIVAATCGGRPQNTTSDSTESFAAAELSSAAHFEFPTATAALVTRASTATMVASSTDEPSTTEMLTTTSRPSIGDAGELEDDDEQVQDDPAPEGGETLTIAFGGDIHFEEPIGTAVAADPTTALAPVAAMMADADIAIANLETTVTERGTPSPKAYNFRTSADAFVALRAAGIDVVSMANNHGMDYGVVGLEDSLAAAEAADFDVIGIGLDANQAYAPWSSVVKGQRVAVIGATHVLESSLRAAWTATDSQPGLASAKEVDRLVAEVEAARGKHDTVIVFLHWGVEKETCPVARQLDLADQLVAAGADIVVGGHAHRLQGGGFKNKAYVHYGLGNFVFYTTDGPGADSGVLRLRVNGRAVESAEWVPARLVNGVATALDGDRAPAAITAWENLRSCTDLTP